MKGAALQLAPMYCVWVQYLQVKLRKCPFGLDLPEPQATFCRHRAILCRSLFSLCILCAPQHFPSAPRQYLIGVGHNVMKQRGNIKEYGARSTENHKPDIRRDSVLTNISAVRTRPNDNVYIQSIPWCTPYTVYAYFVI